MITFNREKIKDKIHACWIGKNIGGTMGTPYEGKRELHDIQGFSTPKSTILPNDDLDLQLVWLKAAEENGPYNLDAKILGEYWINYIPPHWNEYGLCKNNMKIGLLAPLCGEFKNNWKHSNGAWIRTEIWACMAPGCPDIAIKYAIEDACVDHGMGEGTYAAVFVAAIESAAFIENDIRKLIDIGLSKIPEDCRMTRSIRLLLDCYDKKVDWKDARNLLVEDSRDIGWFQAPANVAFSMLGMLYGEGDFKQSMIYAINCGDDTDCTGATLGSLFGILNGTAGIPADWAEHIGDNIVTIAVDKGSCYGLPTTCTQLTDRVMGMIPVMLKANSAQVALSDGQEDIKDYSFDAFMNNNAAKKLLARSGLSFDIDFIYAKARFNFESEPVMSPNSSIKVKIEFFNKILRAQHLKLRWILPDGWNATGPKTVLLPWHNPDDTENYAFTEAEIFSGDITQSINRLYLEVTCDGRATVGMIPVTIIG